MDTPFVATLLVLPDYIHPPPLPPIFWLKGIFQGGGGGGGGGVYFEAPRGRNFIRPPPPFYTPPTPRRVFQGWGCIKFGPCRIRVRG